MKEEKERKRKYVDPIISIPNLLGVVRHVLIKTIETSDGTYIQYGGDGDISFKALSAEEYLMETKIHFIDIIEELRNTRSSWQMKLIVGGVFEYDIND